MRVSLASPHLYSLQPPLKSFKRAITNNPYPAKLRSPRLCFYDEPLIFLMRVYEAVTSNGSIMFELGVFVTPFELAFRYRRVSAIFVLLLWTHSVYPSPFQIVLYTTLGDYTLTGLNFFFKLKTNWCINVWKWNLFYIHRVRFKCV